MWESGSSNYGSRGVGILLRHQGGVAQLWAACAEDGYKPRQTSRSGEGSKSLVLYEDAWDNVYVSFYGGGSEAWCSLERGVGAWYSECIWTHNHTTTHSPPPPPPPRCSSTSVMCVCMQGVWQLLDEQQFSKYIYRLPILIVVSTPSACSKLYRNVHMAITVTWI